MSEQQLITYLYWLRDRGQVLISPLMTDHEQIETDAMGTLPESLPMAHSTPTPSPQKAPSPISIRLLFVSREPLAASELEMVNRIGAALGLRTNDFQVIEESSVSGFAPDFVVAVGDVKDSLPRTLAIHHPRDMLKNPQLKVSAWENLQRLKSQII